MIKFHKAVSSIVIISALLIGLGFNNCSPKSSGTDETVTNTDADSDGVLDTTDNCTNLSNPDQRDLNVDRIGDLCDSQFAAQIAAILND